MQQETARIAFIGAGGHATESLYPNIAHIPEFELVAVCDLVEEKARYWARKFGAPEWFTDVETMLDKVQPQGCCVVGPPAMHHAIGLQVLCRGIPLFVEKPPANSLPESIELAETARAHGTWGMVAFMKRFAPANVLAKEFMQSEAFGTLSSITLMHGCGPYGDPRSMLYFNGIHLIDLGRFLSGEVKTVFAYLADAGRRNFAVSAVGRLANGAVMQLNQNSGHTWQDCYEAVYISGAEAGIFIDASREVEVMSPSTRFAPGHGLHLYGSRARQTVSGNMAGWWPGGHYQRGYWGELSRFARACAGLAAPSPTLDDAVETVRLLEAMLLSAKTGQEVVVAEVGG